MTQFTVHTVTSAPEDARPILSQLQERLGFTPNLAATMASTPTVLESYVTLGALFGRGTFSPVEREIISMTTSFDNQCAYCMAAHSTFAKAQGAADADMEAVRSGQTPDNPRLAALVTFTHQVVRHLGQVSAEDIQAFLDAGFSQAQALEVLIGVSQVTLASLVHRMAETPLDDAFQPQKWETLPS